MYASCPKMRHLDKTCTALRWDIWRCFAQIHKYSVIAYIWLQFTMQTLRMMKIFIELPCRTKAQMCASSPNMRHLDKAPATLRWDIWQCVAKMHKYSVIAYIWLQFTMQTLSKIKNFAICSILTNTLHLNLEPHRSTNVCVLPKNVPS